EVEKDIRVKAEDLHNALDGDGVRIEAYGKAKDGRGEGEVVEIIERKREGAVGGREVSARYAIVAPDSKKTELAVFVRLERIRGAKHDDKVIVRVTQWPKKKDENPKGEVLAVLGPSGENETEIHAIMAEYGLPFSFSEQIEAAAQKLKPGITKSEIARRRD